MLKKNFVIFSVAIVFSFLLVEVISRLIIPTPLNPPPLLKVSPFIKNNYILQRRPFDFFHIPHSQYIQVIPKREIPYVINSFGFREREIDSNPPPNTKRLIVIGDSITEGHGVKMKNRFTDLLRDDAANTGWEIVNYAIQGGSLLHYAVNINRYLELSPSSVLIVLFDNDIWDDRRREEDYDKLKYIENPYVFKKNNFLSLFFRSRFIQLFYQAWNTYCIRPPLNEIEKIIYEHKVNPRARNELNTMSGIPRGQWPISPSLLDHQWSLSKPYFDYIIQKFQEKKIPVFISHFTDKKYGRKNNSWIYSYLLDKKIMAYANYNGLPFFSLLPIVTEYYKNKSYSFHDLQIPHDGHPTEKGHQLIASALKPWLIKNLKRIEH